MNDGITEEKLLYYSDKIIDMCSRKNMKIFDGFVPLIPEMYNDDDNYVIFSDAKPSDLLSPVNVSLFRPGDPDGYKAKKEWQFHRFRQISRKELRKRTGVFALNPYCLEIAYENHQHIADGFYTLKNSKFVPIQIPNYEYLDSVSDEVDITCRICMGMQFNLENQCYVYLKPEYSDIGFKYPIDNMSQLKELFKLRDIPDGYKRRAALRHWVAKHMRHKPSKPDELVDVKRHLRGKEHFNWFGISGTIYVNT